MATTTNYSWTTPDDTALVKDGAAAIRSLGTSIDTTTKALNPSTTLGDIEYRSSTANTNTRLGIGTTGQVLSVSGGVPAWTTPATGMTNPLTTTGDTIYSSSGSTPARLGIGTTGQVLTVAGGVPTWATAGATWTPNYTAINAGGTALTGATTITVSGISGKNSIMILVDGASSANASSAFSVRFNSDSGANYGAVGLVVTNTAAGNTGGYYGGDRIDIAKMTNAAGGACSFNMIVEGANTSGRKFITASSAGDVGTASEFRSINGWYGGTSAISSVSIISSTGNFDAGTIYVFGA